MSKISIQIFYNLNLIIANKIKTLQAKIDLPKCNLLLIKKGKLAREKLFMFNNLGLNFNMNYFLKKITKFISLIICTNTLIKNNEKNFFNTNYYSYCNCM